MGDNEREPLSSDEMLGKAWDDAQGDPADAPPPDEGGAGDCDAPAVTDGVAPPGSGDPSSIASPSPSTAAETAQAAPHAQHEAHPNASDLKLAVMQVLAPSGTDVFSPQQVIAQLQLSGFDVDADEVRRQLDAASWADEAGVQVYRFTEKVVAPPPPADEERTWWEELWSRRWVRWGVKSAAALGVLAVAGVLATSNAAIDLEPGDCFDVPAVEVVGEVDPLDCAEQHEVEVVASIEVAGAQDAPYPGMDALSREVQGKCSDPFLTYTGVAMWKTDLGPYTLSPSQELWESGDRTAKCMVARYSDVGTTVRVEGSLRTDTPVQIPTPFETLELSAVDDVPSSSVLIDDLEPGQCITGLDLSTDWNSTVDCAEPHGAEMFARVNLDEALPSDAYPGDNEVGIRAIEVCEAEFEDYVGTPFAQSKLWVDGYFPNQAGWQAGYRTGTCFLLAADAGGNVLAAIGSSRNSGR